MPGDKIPIPQFAAKIKAKYPEYKDVNDTLLVQKIIAKYPEYKEQVEFEPVQIQEPVKKKEQTGGIGSVIGGQAGSSAGQSEKGLFSKLFDLATTPDKETYDPVSEATKPHREILAEAQGETKQLVPNLQRSDATAVKPYVDINTALKKANTIRDIEANAFPDISTAIQWKDKMDSGALSPKNRTTQLARKIVTDAENTVSALKNSGADYDKGAIEYAMSSNDAFGEAVRKMVKDGKPLDDFVKGEAAMRYLGSRFFRELPDDSPVKQGVIAAAKEAQQKYPSMYFRQLNEKISAKREEMGMNNWFYNEPGVSSSDKAMDALRKEGKISDGEEMAYVNAYRPMMQAGINPGIKTPGFVESTGESISHQLKSAVGLLEDVGEATGASRLYSTVGGDIRRQLREQQQMIKEPNWSYGHQVSRAAGNLTGLIATMGGEGVALKGLGLGANATNAVATGLNFFHDIYKAEEQKHGKGDPMAYLSAITQTVLWSEGTKIFGNAFNDVIKSSKGEVNDILKSLQDGTIQNSDATQSIMNVLLNKITKGGKEAIKDVAKIKGIEVLNGTLSNLFNGQLDIKTPINDALHDTPTFFLSLLPVKVMGAKGKDMTKDYLSSLVKYPELAENITDPKAKQNYESLVKLEPFLNEQGLNDKQKDNYRLLYLKGKILEEQSGALPDKGLSGQLEKNIKENEIAKKAVVDPEMGNKKIVQEFYDNDLLDKGSRMMLENEEGKFSESKVGEYLKSIAQQENGLDENWKPLEGGGAKLKGRVPDTIIELANERWKKEIEAAKPEEEIKEPEAPKIKGTPEDISQPIELNVEPVTEGKEQPSEASTGLSRGDEKNQSVTFVERIFGKAKDKKSKKEEGVVFKTKVQSKVSSDGEVITTKAIGEVEENGVVNNEISVSANNNWVDVNEFNSAIEPYIEKNPKLGYGSNDTWVKWNEMLSEDNPPAKVQFKELREPTEQNTNKRSFLEVKVQYENGETGNFLFEVKPKDPSLSPNIEPKTEQGNEKAINQETDTADKQSQQSTTESSGTVEPIVEDSGGAKKLAEKVRSLKVNLSKLSGGGLQSNVLGLPAGVWNGAMELVAKTIEAGGNAADAIKKGLKYIQANHRGQWDKKGFNDQVMKELGVRGITVNGEDLVVKDSGREFAETVNGWYSDLEQSVLDIKGEKGSGESWKKVLGNSDEAKWTGLNDWLSQQKEPVTKKQIQDFLKENRIQIVEVVKNSENIGAVWNDKYEAWETTVDGKPIGDFADTKEEAISYGKSNFGDNTKFGNYQLEGQKENYKEVLVTMPSRVRFADKWAFYKSKGYSEEAFDVLDDAKKQDLFIEFKAEDKRQRESSVADFKSSHFDEPNILVHLRMNTRTDAEGKKVLFLEEVQSDWGQKGKKEGFEIKEEDRWNFEPIKRNGETVAWKIELKSDKNIGGIGNTKEDAIKDANKRYGTEINTLEKQQKGTPSAPFVTDTNAWTKLGLKVALKEAVKQGADKIGWTTGEQQNDRYDLSKQLKTASASKNNDGTYQLVLEDKSGNEIEGYRGSGKRVTPKEMEDTIGKDISQKLIDGADRNKGKEWKKNMPINPEFYTLSGGDLKIQGKGMKGFYGSPSENKLGIVGEVAKSLFKQEPKIIGLPKEGQKWDGVVRTTEDIKKYSKLGYTFYDNGNKITKQRAYELIERGDRDIDARNEVPTTQHSIEITPELRAAVEKGQPLFKEAEAQYRIESGKNIIEAIKDFDGSPRATVALTHEIMHPTVVSIIDGAKEGNEVGAKHTKTIVDEYNKATGKNITQEQLIEGNDKFKEGTTTKEYRNVQEFIAKAWERYHREGGKGFSEGFQKVLEQITQAFKAVYKSISGKELTPELKQMFDDILGKPQPTETKDTVTKEQVSNETIPEGTKGNESKPTVQEEETGNIPVEVSQSAEGGEPPKPPVEEGTTGMGEDGVSGIKKALVSDKIIEGVDLEKIGDKEMMALGRKIIETGEVKPDALVQKIITEKTGVLTPKEVVSLITYKADIDNGLRDAYKQLNEKKESGEDTGTLGVEIADLERQQNDFDVMAVITANQQSMAFRLRKMMLDRDYNVITQIEKYKKNNNGYIPAEVEAKFRDLDKQLKEVKEKLAEAEKRASDKEGQQAVENIKESVGREKKYTDEELEKKVQEGVQSEVNKIYEQLPVEKKSAADKAIAALERFQKKLRGKAYSDVAGFVAIIDAGVTTIKNAIKLGVSIEKAVELGINKIKEKLKGKKWDKEDEFRKDMIEGFESEGVSTKKVKDKPTINEDGSVSIPNEMLRNLVERGVTDINDLTKEVHKQVVKDLPNITERQVRDYITDYGKKINPTADEVQRQLNTAKRIGRLLSEVEDLQNKKAKEKNPSTLAKLTEKERELKRQIRALEKDAGIDHKRHLTEEEKISEAKERVKNRISELQRAIKNKDFAKKTKLPEPKDDELVRLEAQKQKLEEQYDIEQYRLKLKNRTFWQKAEDVALEATNGLVRGLVASVDLSAGLVQGTRRLFVDLFKSGYQLLTFQKLKPNRSLNAFGTMFKHLVSQKASDDYLAKVKASKLQPLIKASKLAVDDKSGKISIKEGFFISNWINVIWDKAVAPGLSMPISIFTKGNIRKGYDIAKKINPYLASQRAFDGYINSIRVNTFIDFAKRLEQQGYNFESNPEVFKSAADVVNTETGRGGLGAADASSRWLNIFLFAPRKVISEVKLYTPYAFAYYAKMPKVVRMESLKNLAVFMTSFVGANAMFWAANRKGDEDDDFWNPNSSNFLTHKVGNKRISLGGGAKSMIVFQSRLLTGKFTDQYGKTTELGDRFGKQINTRLDLVWRFILGKGSPAVGIISQKLDEKKGLEVDDKDIIKNLSIPIWMQDLKDMYKDDPTSVNAILTAFSIFGANVRTVDEPKSQDNTTSSKERKRPSRSERVKLRHEMK